MFFCCLYPKLHNKVVSEGVYEEVSSERGEEPSGEEKCEVKLKVEDTRQRDVNRGIARIDQETMQKLGLPWGDVIEIVGERMTAAIAWPAYSEDQGRGIIRIDGITRKNADIAINEDVLVRPGKAKDAVNVVLAPVDMRLIVDADFRKFVKNRIVERVFVEGDTVHVMMLGQVVPFTVTKTNPEGVVKVTDATKLEILEEPLEVTLVRRETEGERKKLGRFVWLKAMERKCAADYVKFCIPEWNIETDKEGDALAKAESLVKDKKAPITIFIDLWERRGKIASIQWAKVKPDGVIEYVYPDDSLKICPFCGGPVTPYYGRYYCYRCSRYVS